MRLRDKDYVRTSEDLLFNVTGYDHPSEAVYASLKYVHGEKWTAGYRAAQGFLRTAYPQYVKDYIQVPNERVAEVYCPQRRWHDLRLQNNRGLMSEVVALVQELSMRLGIPLDDWGVTDSLLWGTGHAGSDIDLVVYGQDAARRLTCGVRQLYDHANFGRPDPVKVRAPYGMAVRDWPSLLRRKRHMGLYRGRAFSLRTVHAWGDWDASCVVARKERRYFKFQVANVDASLSFPAVYLDSVGNRLLDYTVTYEGVLRIGDTLSGQCDAELLADGREQFVLLEEQLPFYLMT